MRWLMAIALALVVLIGLLASPPTLLSRWKAARKASWAIPKEETDKRNEVWSIEQLGESVCRLAVESADSVTASFAAHLPGPAWQTRLVRRAGMPVEAHLRYTLRFEAKADAPRSMVVCVGEPGRAGGSLGMREMVDLTTDWSTFEFSYAARHDCDSPQIQFDIGESPEAVSIRDVDLAPGLPPARQ